MWSSLISIVRYHCGGSVVTALPLSHRVNGVQCLRMRDIWVRSPLAADFVSSNAKRSTTNASGMGLQRGSLSTDEPCHSRFGKLKNPSFLLNGYEFRVYVKIRSPSPIMLIDVSVWVKNYQVERKIRSIFKFKVFALLRSLFNVLTTQWYFMLVVRICPL